MKVNSAPMIARSIYVSLGTILLCFGACKQQSVRSQEGAVWRETARMAGLSAQQIRTLGAQGFLIADEVIEQPFEFYQDLERLPTRLFVTTDAMLEGYHALVNSTNRVLQDIAAGELESMLKHVWGNLEQAREHIDVGDPAWRDALYRCRFLLAVPMKLLNPKMSYRDAEFTRLIDEEVKRVKGRSDRPILAFSGSHFADSRFRYSNLPTADKSTWQETMTLARWPGWSQKGAELANKLRNRVRHRDAYRSAIGWLGAFPLNPRSDVDLLALAIMSHGLKDLGVKRDLYPEDLVGLATAQRWQMKSRFAHDLAQAANRLWGAFSHRSGKPPRPLRDIRLAVADEVFTVLSRIDSRLRFGLGRRGLTVPLGVSGETPDLVALGVPDSESASKVSKLLRESGELESAFLPSGMSRFLSGIPEQNGEVPGCMLL
jgi:Protein of unknown function (DUF3160)